MKLALNNTKLVLVSALTCEARPWLDFYGLQKINDKPFQVFADAEQEVAIVISGIGALQAASAIAWIAAKVPQTLAWLNLGTAGHADLPQGDMRRVAAVQSPDSERLYYPPLVATWGTKQGPDSVIAACLSLNQASTDYPLDSLVDMEAYAFFQVSKLFAPPELCAALKVVSDNPSVDLSELNAERIQHLMQKHQGSVVDFIEQIINLRDQTLSSEEEFELSGFTGSYATQRNLRARLESASTLLGRPAVERILSEQAGASAKTLLGILVAQLEGVAPSLKSLQAE